MAELLGGTPFELDTEAEDAIAVDTDTDRVEVVIDGPQSIEFDMKQWVNGKLAHHCDTRAFLSPPEDVGVPCRCPGTVAELKDRAKAERGPKPDIRINFKLAHDPHLGDFRYKSSGWSLISELPALKNALVKTGGPSLVHLVNERVNYTSKAWPRGRLPEAHRQGHQGIRAGHHRHPGCGRRGGAAVLTGAPPAPPHQRDRSFGAGPASVSLERETHEHLHPPRGTYGD